MKKHTHIIYRKKWEGNKKKSKMTVKMEQPLVACAGLFAAISDN